jgi:hypothetical protein
MKTISAALAFLLVASANADFEVPSLTPDNYDAMTNGKTVFLKFFAPWVRYAAMVIRGFSLYHLGNRLLLLGFRMNCFSIVFSRNDCNLISRSPFFNWFLPLPVRALQKDGARLAQARRKVEGPRCWVRG